MKKTNPYGIIIPAITPFKQGKIDEQGIENIVRRTYNYVDSFFCLGYTGEFSFLSTEEKKLVITKYKDAIDNIKRKMREERAENKIYKKLLITGITSSTLEDTLTLGDFSSSYVDAFVILPLKFGTKKSKEIAKLSTKPVLLYNNPQIAGKNLEKDEFEELMKEKNIIGMKDSSGNFELFKKYAEIAEKYNKSMYQGAENLIADSLMLAAAGKCVKGIIPSMANAFPNLFSKLMNAYKDEEFPRMKRYQDEINKLREIYIPAVIPVLKKTLELESICTSETRIKTNLSKKEVESRARGMRFTYYIFKSEWP